MVPQTIFVVYFGRLVVPLGRTLIWPEPLILDTPDKIPEARDMVILRIEIEHRGTGARLLIDFIPYALGLLSFPPLDLSKFVGEPLIITGLEAHVSSILSPSRMDLSEPASPLAVPGTSVLVYGTLVLILFLLFLGIGGSIWGRSHFRELWGQIRRRHLLRVMEKFLRRLRQENDLEKEGKAGSYLTLLSQEFREFLSFFTGINCRSLTALEFLELPLGDSESGLQGGTPINAAFLCRLFRSWDTLRFSGRAIEKADLIHAVDETDEFIIALYRAEKERSLAALLKKSPGVPEAGDAYEH
jgi:hypothetical protein